MNKFLVAFLSILMLTGVCIAQEDTDNLTDDPAIQQALSYIMFSDSVLEDTNTTMPAWLTYAFARMVWLKDNMNMPLEDITPEIYQKSFEEELHGRESLAVVWDELKVNDTTLKDTYLDELFIVQKAGYMPEYVWAFTSYDIFKEAPTDERMEEFEMWFYDTMPNHEPQTLVSLVWEVPTPTVTEEERQIYYKLIERGASLPEGASEEAFDKATEEVAKENGLTFSEMEALASRVWDEGPSKDEWEIMDDLDERLLNLPTGYTMEDTDKVFIEVGKKYGLSTAIIDDIYMRSIS